MKLKHLILALVLLPALAVSGCLSREAGKTGGALSVSQLLEEPVYDTEVRVYGEVALLGQLNCPCFELVSGGEKVVVWYALMVEDDRTERPPVSIEGITNGDRVVVTGELKTAGEHRQPNDFWAGGIEEIE